MTDDKKKKPSSKPGTKKGHKKPTTPPSEHTKVSVYAETLKRKNQEKKANVSKSRNVIRKRTKFIMIAVFFCLSFVFSKFFLADLFIKKDFSEKILEECSGEYDFSESEKELLSISSQVIKPIEADQRIDPCDSNLHSKILAVNNKFSERNEKGDLLSVLKMDEEIRKRGKITKLAVDTEEIDVKQQRLSRLFNYSDSFREDYVRFRLLDEFPANALYFGLIFDKVDDVKKKLKSLRCDSPKFHFANHRISYLGLFFTLNAKRGYAGRVRTLNNRYRNLIEGQLGIYEYPREPFHRYLPSGNFEMRVHPDSKVNYKGFYYQRQWISQEYRFDWDRSPWLYNSCRNSIATVSNYCALDPTYDMQYKDLFYLVNEDRMIGNIYCKKSSEQVWSRVGTLNLMRVK